MLSFASRQRWSPMGLLVVDAATQRVRCRTRRERLTFSAPSCLATATRDDADGARCAGHYRWLHSRRRLATTLIAISDMRDSAPATRFARPARRRRAPSPRQGRGHFTHFITGRAVGRNSFAASARDATAGAAAFATAATPPAVASTSYHAQPATMISPGCRQHGSFSPLVIAT